MSDKEMSWQRYEAGTGDSEALYYFPVNAQHVTSPVTAMRATLIESDLDKIRQIVETTVHKAIFGDPVDNDDLPVRRDAPDPGGDTDDDERVEAHIVTVKDTPHVYHDATGTCVICSRCQGLMGFTIGQSNPEIRAFLKALEPFVKCCECKEVAE